MSSQLDREIFCQAVVCITFITLSFTLSFFTVFIPHVTCLWAPTKNKMGIYQQRTTSHYNLFWIWIWGSNQQELNSGSSHLRIQYSHLIFTFIAGLRSSVFTYRKFRQIFSVHFSTLTKIVSSFSSHLRTMIVSLPRNPVRANFKGHTVENSKLSWGRFHFIFNKRWGMCIGCNYHESMSGWGISMSWPFKLK